jgi:hypothetical protein
MSVAGGKVHTCRPLICGGVLMTSQTEAARADLRIANQYIEEWEKAVGKRSYREAQEQLSPEVSKYLDWALSYINQARQKDNSVTLQVKMSGARNPALRDKVGLTTPDALEADILFLKAVPHIPRSDEERILAVKLDYPISLLQRSIQLEPLMSETHVQLAYAHAWKHERDKALSVLHNAVKMFPDDFRVRSTLDYFQSDPLIGLPMPADEGTQTRGGMSLLSFGFLLLAVSLTTLLIFGTTSLEKTAIGGVMVPLGMVSVCVSGILVYFGIKSKIEHVRDRIFGVSLGDEIEKQQRQNS